MKGRKGQLNKSESHNNPYMEPSVKKTTHFNGTSPLARFVPLTASAETLKCVASSRHPCSLPLRTVKLAHAQHGSN